MEKSLTSYLLDGRWGYKIPESFSKWYDKIKQKYKVKLRFVRVKDVKKEIATVVDISNRSYTNYWGYAQISQEEADEIAKILKPVINDKCILLAEVNDTAIGFSIAFPDFYIPLRESKGKVFPLIISFLLAPGLLIGKVQAYLTLRTYVWFSHWMATPTGRIA